MHLQELSAYLRSHANIDVHAEFAVFQQQTGSHDLDRFLAYLRQRELISSDTFRDLHGRGHIEISRYQGVTKQGTLVLEQRPRTPILDQPTATPAAAPIPTPVPAAASDQATLLDPNMPHPVMVQGAAATPAGAAPSSASQEHGLDGHGYEILGDIAKGAMGEVFVARDLELLRKVAYKRMLPHLMGNPALAARFFGEVQITAQLDHPNIVPIHEIEVAPDGRLGYSMKLIQGKTLAKLIKSHRDAALADNGKDEAARLNERIELFLKVCDAMAYAHEKGVLHRDLKPDNIMVGRFSEVYVMDWGICRLMNVAEDDMHDAAVEVSDKHVYGQTSYGAIMGTPAYMSPEQAQGRVPELDRRSDVYALGLILFELVTLRPAITAPDMAQLLARAGRGDKDRLVHIRPRVRIARELAAIIDKATQPDLGSRYSSVDAMVEDLRRYVRGLSVSARPDNIVQSMARWVARHKMLVLLMMAFVLLAGASGVITMLVTHERQLEAARVREERMQAFVLAVSQRSHGIDSYFFNIEKHLARLAGRVKEVFAHQSDFAGKPVHVSADFDAGGDRAPPDLAPSSHYGQPVSTAYPVFKLAPGVDADEVSEPLQAASHLRPALLEMMLHTADETLDVDVADDSVVRELIAEHGVAVIRAFVTLQSGIHMSYPGTGGYPDEYDGRLRPKYTLATGKRGIQWGNPFQDRYGHGLILPSSIAVYDAGGELMGVTGIELTFDWLIDTLLVMPDAPYVDAIHLVDGDGRVVISSSASGAARPAATAATGVELSNEAAELARLPYADVVAALARGRAGSVHTTVDGADKIIAFYRLDALGWWYVVIADEARLLGEPGKTLTSRR